jgi:hypothetical protein
VVQYEERDSIVMAPQQQRSAQMWNIFWIRKHWESGTHNARAADSVRLTCGQNESPSVDVHTHAPIFPCNSRRILNTSVAAHFFFFLFLLIGSHCNRHTAHTNKCRSLYSD